MDKSDYVRLNDETKFKPVSAERPKTRGRPPKYFHPLLEKENELTAAVKRSLPKDTADSVVQKVQDFPTCMKYQRLTRKKLAMRSILSATGTYNYKLQLAKWLDEKLKPLSVNEHTVTDIFGFVDDLQNIQVDDHSILV